MVLNNWRLVQSSDPVPRIPPYFVYHTHNEVWFDKPGLTIQSNYTICDVNKVRQFPLIIIWFTMTASNVFCYTSSTRRNSTLIDIKHKTITEFSAAVNWIALPSIMAQAELRGVVTPCFC